MKTLRQLCKEVVEQEQETFALLLKRVKRLNKKQLEELLLVGSESEKRLAKIELTKIDMRVQVKKQMLVMVEDTANAAFEEALNKAGYKLVGHIEKIET